MSHEKELERLGWLEPDRRETNAIVAAGIIRTHGKFRVMTVTSPI